MCDGTYSYYGLRFCHPNGPYKQEEPDDEEYTLTEAQMNSKIHNSFAELLPLPNLGTGRYTVDNRSRKVIHTDYDMPESQSFPTRESAKLWAKNQVWPKGFVGLQSL